MNRITDIIMDIVIYLLVGPIIALVLGVITIVTYIRHRIRYRGIDDRTKLELTNKNN